MGKNSKKYSTVLFGLFMSLGMSFFMSLIITLINLGLTPGFFWKWMRGFAIGFSVGFPVALVIVPIVRKVTKRLTGDKFLVELFCDEKLQGNLIHHFFLNLRLLHEKQPDRPCKIRSLVR